MDNLENILESILFVSGDAVDINDIAGKIDASKQDIKNAVKKLKNKYKEDSGITLLEFNNKLQFASSSKYAEEVSKVLNPIRQRNLSKATLETASIIAYKQPVTRLEIEEIRGVSSDYAINILLEHNLIEIVGRKDTVGKPILFGTTDEFLKRFNISSIDDLPDYNEILERVKVIKNGDNSLYNRFEIKESDEEMEEKLGLNKDVAMASAEGENLESPEDFEVLEGKEKLDEGDLKEPFEEIDPEEHDDIVETEENTAENDDDDLDGEDHLDDEDEGLDEDDDDIFDDDEDDDDDFDDDDDGDWDIV